MTVAPLVIGVVSVGPIPAMLTSRTVAVCPLVFFFSSRRRHTRLQGDWSSDVCSSDLPCSVEVASEYRYRTSVPHPKTLVVTISQSGETADTLAALRHAQSLGMKHTLIKITSGMPLAFTSMCRFEPSLPLSVGFGPVS